MRRRLNIMLVEDYDELRDAIVEKLGQDGHQVIGVPMAEDVDDTPNRSVPDLYIIDLNLPGEDGLSLARRIRRHHPDVAIVMATARASVADRIVGYEAGAHVYIPKPFSLDELRAVISSIGERLHQGPRGADTSACLDLLGMQFIGPKATVTMNAEEIQLLSAFARTHEQVLERWQVAQHLTVLMGAQTDQIKVKISRLRKKLLQAGIEEPAVKAIREFGYKLCFRFRVSSNPSVGNSNALHGSGGP